MPCRINVFSGRKRERSTRKKNAKRWFGRVFAWRPFASPGKDTTNSSRKRNAWNAAYFRVAGRKVAMRKHEKVTIWRVFAYRLFAFSSLFVVSLPGRAKGRHAKTRQIVTFSCFRQVCNVLFLDLRIQISRRVYDIATLAYWKGEITALEIATHPTLFKCACS